MADKKQKRIRGQYDLTLYNSPIYKSWQNMKTRCTNKNSGINYTRYGERGIMYCKEWKNFPKFLEDMGDTYDKGLTLERIDNNKGYSVKNCRWATRKEQANNRRTNTFLTINNITKTFAQWCTLSSVKPSTIRQRYYSYGWTLEKSLSI